MTDKPLLFLDVDGPLNPYESIRRGLDGYTLHIAKPSGHGNGLKILLDHDHGRRLLELPYDLVWATTWNAEANEWIGPHIGLPQLPVVELDHGYKATRQHWKTEQLIKYADGRPFVWVDDECGSYDWQLIQEQHGPHGEIYRVSPRTGLTSADFYQLKKKAEEVMKNQ